MHFGERHFYRDFFKKIHRDVTVTMEILAISIVSVTL